MANTLDAVIPQILAMGLLALRKQVVLPSVVNRDYDTAAAERGDTIDIPKPGSITAQQVSPSNTAPSTSDIEPDKVQVSLDQWYEAPFYMTDKDIAEVMNGTLPMQVSEAIRALAETVNSDLFGAFYKKVPYIVGTAGTTPFGSDYSEASAARKQLNTLAAPMNPRFMVIDPDAEENAINLSSFADASFSDDNQVLQEGMIGRKLGFNWLMDQQVPTHTAGSLTGDPTVSGAHATGVSSVTIATDADDQVDLKEGDIINFAGDTQNYAVTADASAGNSSSVAVGIYPALKVALSGGEAITLAESSNHVANLAFHRDAFVFATRPLEAPGDGLGNIIQSTVDPVSGLSLRLEVSRQHKQTRWSFDILWGRELLREELATRVMG